MTMREMEAKEKRIELPNEVLLEYVDSVLDKTRSVVLRCKGNSMLPFMRNGVDSVELVRTSAVAVGDIVLARIAPACYVMHRVIAVEDGSITMMGDGNLSGTEKAALDDVIAQAVAVIRPDGTRVSLTDAKAMRRAWIWKQLLPVRRVLLAIYRRI